MKRIAATLLVLLSLALGACTFPYFGVTLRFQRDMPTSLREVRAIAEQFGFTEERIGNSALGRWELVLSMGGKRIVRRAALGLAVVRKPEGLSIGVGRTGGVGLSLLPEEIALIRDLCAKLQTLPGYTGVEREAGMHLCDDASKRPNQAPEPTTLLVTPRAGARVAPSSAVAHL